MDRDSILDVQNLCKNYGGFALREISFSLPQGYIMGLIGANGAGKTTTINLILNLIRRDSGSVSVFGRDNIREEAAVKQQVGVVFDSSPFVEDWKVADAGDALAIFYRDWNRQRFGELLREFSLDPGKKVKELSRGMQTKLMLACAFAHDARLLILDEPTSGMDPLAREELLDMLRQYIDDGRRSVLFSTHITADLEKAADYITYIRSGALFFTGTTDRLLEEFCVIKGGREDLSEALRPKISGLRMHHTGFEGLVRRTDCPAPPAGCLLEKVSIDDIMVYTAKESA